jgi:hypothetical protein
MRCDHLQVLMDAERVQAQNDRDDLQKQLHQGQRLAGQILNGHSRRLERHGSGHRAPSR